MRFKGGFSNAILFDRTGGIGDISDLECCASRADNCTFRVVPSRSHRDTPLGI